MADESDKKRGSKQIAPQLDAADKKAAEAKERLASATPATYDKLNSEYKAAVKQRNIVKKQFDEAVSREKGAVETVKSKNEAAVTGASDLQSKGAETIRQRQNAANDAKQAWQNDPTDKDKFDNYQTKLGELSAKFDEYAAKGVVFPRTVATDSAGGFKEVSQGATVTTGQPTGVGAASSTTTDGGLRGGSIDRPAPTVAGTTGAVVGTGTGTGVVTPTGITTSGAAPKGGKGKGKGKGAVAGSTVVDTSWEPLFKSQYPQYAWMFTDEMKTKYPDVFQLFKEASADPEFDPNLFARRFDGSSWYTELKASTKSRELISSIGSFTWGSGNLAKFLTTAEQYSWTGEALKQNAYAELFRKGGDGKYANDLAVKEVQASSPYQKLKRIGTQFLAPMSDDRVIESLTGGISSDDVLRLARERAKAMYPHLAANIDAGLTLEDLAYDYKQMAARTLELTPEQVDMSNAKFNVALKSGEGGKERMLSTGEWEQKLRTDEQYGYHFTKQANRDATDIGLAIAKAFGKTGA